MVSGTYEAPFGMRVGGILFARSGFPYTGVVGLDADGDGFTATTQLTAIGPRRSAGTRSAIRRQATLDTSVAYDLKLGGRKRIEIRFDAFNLANRKNITTVNNIIGLDPGIRRRPSAR